MVRGSPRMCIRITGTQCFRAMADISEEICWPTTLLMISVPSRMAESAAAAWRVSTETGIFNLPCSFCSTGKIRASSSSAEIGSAPGLVDSPPMSRISAPSLSISNARSAAASAFKNLPPSEKLSGVILSTPIISVRLPRIRVRDGSRSRYLARGIIFSMNTDGENKSVHLRNSSLNFARAHSRQTGSRHEPAHGQALPRAKNATRDLLRRSDNSRAYTARVTAEQSRDKRAQSNRSRLGNKASRRRAARVQRGKQYKQEFQG